MRKIVKAGLVLLTAIFLTGCVMTGEPQETTQLQNGEPEAPTQGSVAKEPVADINDIHLRDNEVLYENEDDTSVVTMYLTVSRGNDAENTNHTWEEINKYSAYNYEQWGVDRYQVEALLQIGDENGPLEGELGFGEVVPNATVQIRGQSSSKNAQKNYKVRLKDNKGTWRDQQTINLNKHQSDGLRFRNKMAYELIQGIPQMMSLRTQFVHLYVKDNTSGDDKGFVDYGLYTQVEQLNKTGMKAHGLDKNGQLYKINFFEFFRYEDVIHLETDPRFNKAAFEEMLEIKGDTNHAKLIEMLEALNDHSNPIDPLIDRYFDRENLTYWMAFHILTGNVDTQSRNTYLYSPQNSNTWYLISWDNDAAFFNTEFKLREFAGKGSWEAGVSNYWGNVLFQRCLKSESFRQELDRVILELKDYLNAQRLTELIQRYNQVVTPYVERMPDRMHLRLTEEQREQVMLALPGEVEENYQLYLESLKKPMPFYIGVPVAENGKMKIGWEPSYDFDAESITYTAEISKNYDFRDVLFKVENQVFPEIEIDALEPGQYFVRVRATNASGYSQDAFDYYVTENGKHFGMMCFYVLKDGTIQEDVYVEGG